MSRSALRPQDSPSEPTEKKKLWQCSEQKKKDMNEPMYMATAISLFRMKITLTHINSIQSAIHIRNEHDDPAKFQSNTLIPTAGSIP
jgi:hypothetical protein